MVKLLPFLILIIVAGSVMGTKFYLDSRSDTDSGRTNTSEDKRLDALESLVLKLTEKINNSEPDGTPSAASNTANLPVDTRLKTLEKGLVDLKNRVSELEAGSSAITVTKRPPLYIPLGTGGTSTALAWQTIDTFEVKFNPADYPSMTSLQLEASLRVFQGNGKAFARVYSSEDLSAYPASEISTVSQDYTWVTSKTFAIPSAQKTLKLQLQTSTGYEVSIQSARLKVNF